MQSEVTQVKLLYNDDALYVGARLQRGDPSAIRTSIMRRDGDSDAEGWTAELRIPFSQLRFNAVPEQTWGLQLTRNIADKSERSGCSSPSPRRALHPTSGASRESPAFHPLGGWSCCRTSRRISPSARTRTRPIRSTHGQVRAQAVTSSSASG